MPTESSRYVQALLQPCPNQLTHSLLVSAEESLMAVDALKMTLTDLQEVHAKLQELVDGINTHPSDHEEN
jgi:hypothetical protein